VKQLILIRGLSGTGKTTLAETICGDLEDRFMVSADDFFVDDSGEYNFNPDLLKKAHTWCQKECLEAMEDGFEIIVVHNTFTRKWECDPYLEMAQKNNYVIQVLSLYDGGLSDQELSQRGTHNLSAYQIQKQRKRWDKDVYRDRKPQQNYRQPRGNPHFNPHFNPYYPPPNYDHGHYQKKNHRW